MKLNARNIIAVCCVVVIAAAAVVVGLVAYGYWQGQHAYEELASEAASMPAEKESDLAALAVDWEALRKANADTVGWVRIPGTLVDYPIVQAADNETYLHLNFNGEAATGLQPTYGTPFLLAENAGDFSDAVNIVQAHNMANGSMFSELNKMLNSESERNGHRTVYVMSPECNYRCETVAIVTCNASDELVRTALAGPEGLASYLESAVSRSVVSLDASSIDLESAEKVFVLSTCTNDSAQRCLLFCVVIDSLEL